MGYIYASLWRVVNQKCPFSLAHETVLWCPPTKFVAQQINNALMDKPPHSGHIPASSLGSFRGTEIATRGPSATVNQARKFGFVSVVDGP